MDQNLKIADVNDAYCKMIGYERDEILGKTPLDLATDDFRQFMVANREKLLAMDMKDTGHFMTLFYLEIDARKNTAHWVRAGHEPALIHYPSEDKFDSLGGSRLPLGVDEEFNKGMPHHDDVTLVIIKVDHSFF